MRNLIEFLVLHIVSHPEDVVVTEHETNGLWEYDIEVNPEDMGRVIGHRGKTIEAIRTLVRVRAMKENKGVRVQLIDQEEAPTTESDESDTDTETAA